MLDQELSRAGQTYRPSLEVRGLEDVPRPVVPLAIDFPDGHIIPPHTHRRAQLIYAARGVMTVSVTQAKGGAKGGGGGGLWVIPPQRALWMPAGIDHSIRMTGAVEMRTLYLAGVAASRLPADCRVVAVSPLLRELILRAMGIPPLYDEDGPDGRLMAVVLDQLRVLPVMPLHLPMPEDRRLAGICRALLDDLSDNRPLAAWARQAGASISTLGRLFRDGTGMGFTAWRQQARLVRALELLAAGRPVTLVALDLGYDSVSAFIAMFRRAFGVPPARYFRD
ncbi:MAG: helix-turn-helix transcriptional regulator [Alphaproteobacteria bacterium]|nr:helix-turn-helix transcriptional regulator [Alphaproteobacteria bacterium]MBU0798665.1 helix-turn-helix transcriptional regulator [Alphaproteobacteria bacterium]MBU0885928.1 helix-turn-helix transcriptional regulator [Alphaproteobacteria bacterium]MBU1811917.1 helix-turn-helix transcriptional regulator [Alphaproteobacteria bacterium]MBU2090670.1 helix-turn-helix transcriptional regulator [Alphaproteobacteria bacterium]